MLAKTKGRFLLKNNALNIHFSSSRRHHRAGRRRDGRDHPGDRRGHHGKALGIAGAFKLGAGLRNRRLRRGQRLFGRFQLGGRGDVAPRQGAGPFGRVSGGFKIDLGGRDRGLG